jgi:4-hydroxy-tetrahydrodipicolinate synthase
MMDLIVAGKTSEAAAEHLRLTPIFKGLFIVSNPIPVKYGINQAGFSVGKPRLPLTEPDERTAQQLQAMIKEYTVDLLVAARV